MDETNQIDDETYLTSADICIKCEVLYDFSGDREKNELIARANDVICIIKKNIDGWWEGTLNGITGLIPGQYVRPLEPAVSWTPPPSEDFPSPPDFENENNDSLNVDFDSDEDIDYQTIDDCWEQVFQEEKRNNEYNQEQESVETEITEHDNTASVSEELPANENKDYTSKASSVTKDINRYSTFVRSGCEGFLLELKPEVVGLEKKLKIMDISGHMVWQKNPTPFTCQFLKPEKKVKFIIKGYIYYPIQLLIPVANLDSGEMPLAPIESIVGHRYKHFDWLYKRLRHKFPCTPVLRLPEKELTGRYTEELIRKRRYLLEQWLNRVARHPVLSQSDVFQHFLNVSSEGNEDKWKVGKRNAERDPVVGSYFFHSIDAPPLNMSLQKVETEVESFKEFITNMMESTSTMIEIGEKNWNIVKLCKNNYDLAFGFQTLSNSFATEISPDSLPLTQAISHTGEVLNSIGDLCQEQPNNDMLQVLEVLREYKRILATYPYIIDVHKKACNKTNKELLKDENAQNCEISKRMNVVSSTLLAEINHFQRERCKDFRKMMQRYIREQVKFYEKIIEKLNSSLVMYDHIPD